MKALDEEVKLVCGGCQVECFVTISGQRVCVASMCGRRNEEEHVRWEAKKRAVAALLSLATLLATVREVRRHLRERRQERRSARSSRRASARLRGWLSRKNIGRPSSTARLFR